MFGLSATIGARLRRVKQSVAWLSRSTIKPALPAHQPDNENAKRHCGKTNGAQRTFGCSRSFRSHPPRKAWKPAIENALYDKHQANSDEKIGHAAPYWAAGWVPVAAGGTRAAWPSESLK